VDEPTAERYAAIYLALRNAGTPVPTNDMWIAASALRHQLPLFTYDAHFRNVPGLAVGTTVREFTSLTP